jgi:uncharacterized protein (DUF1697 family)
VSPIFTYPEVFPEFRFSIFEFRRSHPRDILALTMPAIISMLRGVNVGGHNKIKMDDLRALYQSLKLKSPQTYVQSGNVIFLSGEKNLASLSQRIQDGIQRKFGFRPDVILRTASELRHVLARNPFASRHNIEPSKLLIAFLTCDPGPQVRESVMKIDARGEELHIHGSELYIYFPNGIGKTKFPWPTVERTLKTPFTGRNWNSVTKMLEIAENVESPD